MSADVLRDVKDNSKIPCCKITSALSMFLYLPVCRMTDLFEFLTEVMHTKCATSMV